MCTPTLSCSKPAMPHLSTLWSCPERMPWGNEQHILLWEAVLMPISPNLTAKRASLCLACANPLGAHGEAHLWGESPSPGLGKRGSFSCIGSPFDGQLYLLWNEGGTEQRSPCLLPLHAVSLEAWGWPAGLSTRLRLGGLSHPGTLS